MMLFRQTLWKFWEDDDYIKLDFSTKTLHIHIINLTVFRFFLEVRFHVEKKKKTLFQNL